MNLPPRTEAIMQATEVRITREFGRPNARALQMARTMLRLTDADPLVRGRYVDWLRRARALRVRLDFALIVIENARRAEIDIHQRSAGLWGHSIHSHIDLDIATEARFLLRWIRRHCPQLWPEIMDGRSTLRKV